jgi:hypothetical protein
MACEPRAWRGEDLSTIPVTHSCRLPSTTSRFVKPPRLLDHGKARPHHGKGLFLHRKGLLHHGTGHLLYEKAHFVLTMNLLHLATGHFVFEACLSELEAVLPVLAMALLEHETDHSRTKMARAHLEMARPLREKVRLVMKTVRLVDGKVLFEQKKGHSRHEKARPRMKTALLVMKTGPSRLEAGRRSRRALRSPDHNARALTNGPRSLA